MGIFIWITIGAIVGWLSYSLMRFNVARGLSVSIVIGIAGAMLGGDVLGPLLASNVHPGDFNPLALFMAFAVAAACLIIGNLIHRRFGV